MAADDTPKSAKNAFGKKERFDVNKYVVHGTPLSERFKTITNWFFAKRKAKNSKAPRR